MLVAMLAAMLAAMLGRRLSGVAAEVTAAARLQSAKCGNGNGRSDGNGNGDGGDNMTVKVRALVTSINNKDSKRISGGGRGNGNFGGNFNFVVAAATVAALPGRSLQRPSLLSFCRRATWTPWIKCVRREEV